MTSTSSCSTSNNYHQFQPMLYQVATAQLAAYDIARPLRGIFRAQQLDVEVRHTGVTSIDPDACSVTTRWDRRSPANYLVLAPGAQANFFGTPGAAEHSLPLYSVNDAERLRWPHSRGLGCDHRTSGADREGCFELRDRRRRPDRRRNGGGTGRGSQRRGSGEISSRSRYAAQVHLVDHGDVLLAPFSDKAHAYAAKHGG